MIASSNQALSHTFVEIIREVISTVIHSYVILYDDDSPSAYARRANVGFQRKYLHEVLVNRLV